MYVCMYINNIFIEIFIDIQDNVIVKGMGKLSMPVVSGNLISLPNFLGMHSVLKTGQN